MHPIPGECPVCQHGLTVTKLYCRECDTTIEGRFLGGPFAQLTPEQIDFVEIFIRNEGKLNRMEDDLELSYPTIRNRLHDVIRALGYEPGKEAAAKLSEEERRKILEDLNQGKINSEEAMEMLREN
ncbi:MAG: DUF2089 domain-containing protein [Chloroflexi bacterium]|nr:MAG: DUF2089 domain-containing protein [Chloroflexota bacterium]MBL1197041.1 DUF2089 domain-containing protein [Chloroflexota bacterium]NOH14336.1 DUF2089 domain-containing protein [Chloroflexota bacterium]